MKFQALFFFKTMKKYISMSSAAVMIGTFYVSFPNQHISC